MTQQLGRRKKGNSQKSSAKLCTFSLVMCPEMNFYSSTSPCDYRKTPHTLRLFCHHKRNVEIIVKSFAETFHFLEHKNLWFAWPTNKFFALLNIYRISPAIKGVKTCSALWFFYSFLFTSTRLSKTVTSISVFFTADTPRVIIMIALRKVAHFPPSEGLCAHIYFKKLAVWSFYVRLSSQSTKTPPSQPSQRRRLKKAYFSKSSVQCWRVTLISFQWISIIVSLYFVSLFEILRTSCFRVTRFRKSKRSSKKKSDQLLL